jgi:actin related protein 2/3 complex subunit 2
LHITECPRTRANRSYVRAPPASIDQTVSDFDGVTFHISTPETKTQVLLSIQIRCFPDLVKYGAEEVLQREYGDYMTSVEPGFDFSVLVDLENLPESKGGATCLPNDYGDFNADH